MRHIPNLITCINILAGTLAIIFALVPGAAPACGPSGMEWAYIFIGIAATADFFDGFAARALRAYSDMGKELDSLCDAVSFGVAPAMCLFATLTEYAPENEWMRWGALLIPIAGVLRLARFNIDPRQTTSFIGLPIPANAIFWIGYTVLITESPDTWGTPAIILPLIIVESWLMLSDIHLFSLKFKTWGWKENWQRWVLIAAAIIFVAVCGLSGLAWLIPFYILLSLIQHT